MSVVFNNHKYQIQILKKHKTLNKATSPFSIKKPQLVVKALSVFIESKNITYDF